MLNKIKKWLPFKRKIMQLYFAVLFNANLKGFVTGNIYQGSSKKVCVPGINCYSCPGAVGACPIGSLQGSFSADHSTIYYVCGILLLYSLMFGRMICGWLCGFGLIQELLHKIPTPKLKKSPVTRLLSFFKYAVLIFFVLIVPITYAFRDTPLPAFCKYICPAGTLEGGVALLSNAVNESYFSMLGPLFTWKFMLMVSILVGSIFIFRLFCRFICPLGALYGLFNRFSFFGIKVNMDKCVHCGLCVNQCKLDIKHVGDQECISCGECVGVCPTKAISWKGPKILVAPNEGIEKAPEKYKKQKFITRCISAAVMIAVLVGAIVYYWNQPDASNPDPGTVTADRGNQEGDLCYGYELPIIDENGDSGETIDPSATGKVTVINFWGTWCPPCVGELPYFDQIASEYADSVTVVAIHSALSKETAPAYIAENYPDSSIIFSWDGGDALTGEYYPTLGGRGTYPYTLVLNENGIITKVFMDAVTYEELKQAVDACFDSTEQSKQRGNQEGDLCYGYDLEIVDENGGSGETVDPSATGKVTVINFWGTWCTPCVAELPYFDQIASEYADTVTVIAVHSAASKETAPAYIADHYPDSNVIFSWDGGEGFTGEYYTALGGRGTYPYTLVLDENGIITKVFFSSVTYEDLKQAVDACFDSTEQSKQRGNREGDLCYSYDLEIVDENGGSGETVDPSATGKVTVINFWGTWCTPCVAELPYFDQIASEYADTVTVMAVHSAASKETAPAYIADHYPDSNVIFSWDGGEGFTGEYYTALGGRGTYPYTLVLDENGIITKVFFSSVTYEDLKQAVDITLNETTEA